DVDEIDGEIGGKKGPLTHHVHAVPKRVAIMQNFFRVRRKVGSVTLGSQTTKQLIVRGEDVLDLGAEFRFLKSEGVKQNRWIRNSVGAALQFGEGTAGARGGFEDAGRFEFYAGR